MHFRSAATVLLLGVVAIGQAGCEAEIDTEARLDQGIKVGESIAAVEQRLGPAVSTLANVGADVRTYKDAQGRRYTLRVENGRVTQLQ